MNRLHYLFLTFFLLTLAPAAHSQQVAIGQWRDELPYALVNSVADAGTRIYASTPYAVFYINREDNSVGRITKISGLSDIGIRGIRYNAEYKTLVIAYTNANIDLIRDNTVINISDIKRKPIGNKTINDVFFIGKNAYLSCGFGIVVLDLVKEEIRDTYYIGQNGAQVDVLAITKDSHDTLFVGTEKGIYRAPANDPNLSNFATWVRDTRMDTTASYPAATFFSGKVFISKRKGAAPADTIYTYENGKWQRWANTPDQPVRNLATSDQYLMVTGNNHVWAYGTNLELYANVYGAEYPLYGIPDHTGLMWVGDTYTGLVSFQPGTGLITHVNLGGPSSAMAFSMTGYGNDIYIAPGGRNTSYGPTYTRPAVYHFNNDAWFNIEGYRNPVLNQAYDVVSVAVDPSDPKRIWAGTFGKGVVEIYNDSAVKRYTYGNSSLRNFSGSDTSDIRVGGVATDPDGNLWVVCSFNNKCLHLKRGNQWTSFSIPIEIDMGQILIDRHGQKWVQLRYGTMNSNPLLVFTDNHTPDNPADDHYRLLNAAAGSGKIPGTTLYAMAEDKNGEIWIGTDDGIAVFYTPENAFTGENFDAQQILVTQGNNVEYLLSGETVTAIAVDGANQKWVGTDRGGVYLFSEDGTKEIFHFTADDSPLLSDRITCIALNKDGNVFFGTDNGVISFRASASSGEETNHDVYAFPNPVKEDYDGFIAVKGLVKNASVRITDINGTLVYAGHAGSPTVESLGGTSAETGVYGGQVVWNGRNFDGKKAGTGVYLVFSADDNGNEKLVTKILIVR